MLIVSPHVVSTWRGMLVCVVSASAAVLVVSGSTARVVVSCTIGSDEHAVSPNANISKMCFMIEEREKWRNIVLPS